MPTKTSLGIFLQARMGSQRLPGKTFKRIGGRPVLKIMADNIRRTPYGGKLYLLTTTSARDDKIIKFAEKEHIRHFRGSEHDVLDRFVRAARCFDVDDVVRLTGDCPFLSMDVLTENIRAYYRAGRPDYFFVRGYPNGIGAVEVMSKKALELCHKRARGTYYREHVVTYLEDHPKSFRLVIRRAPASYFWPNLRLTLDEPADLHLLRKVYAELDGHTGMRNIFRLFRSRPELASINAHVRQKGRARH